MVLSGEGGSTRTDEEEAMSGQEAAREVVALLLRSRNLQIDQGEKAIFQGEMGEASEALTAFFANRMCFNRTDFLVDALGAVAQSAPHDHLSEWLGLPLEFAAAAGNWEHFKALLLAGARVTADYRGRSGRTLYDAAVEGGNRDIKFIAHPFALDQVSPALYRAACLGEDHLACCLVVLGADVNFRCPVSGCNVLTKAVHGGCESLVDLLLLRGASPTDDLLQIAAAAGSEGMVDAFCGHSEGVEVRDLNVDSALMMAAKKGHSGVVERLMRFGAIVENTGSPEAVVNDAAKSGRIAVLKAFLKYITEPCADFKTNALHVAAENNQVGAIDVLVASGIDVELRCSESKTSLYWATSLSNLGVMRSLVSHGASVTSKVFKVGTQYLHAACEFQTDGFPTAIDMLLRAGADETAVDNFGKTPVQLIENGPGSVEHKERARTLLVRAPQDRAWRRRSWLVFLRSRALKERGGGEGASEGLAAKAPRVERVGDDGGAAFEARVGLLVGLEEDGVFRIVVSFL